MPANPSSLKVAAVGRWRRSQAITFLAAGSEDSPIAAARASLLASAIHSTGANECQLWWARRGWAPVAAAAVLVRPGRTGMLLVSPAEAPGVDAGAAAELVAALSEHAIRQHDLHLIQSLHGTDEQADVEICLRAHYAKLAELVYLRRWLADQVSCLPELPPGVSFRDVAAGGSRELTSLIQRTYIGSQDCPAMAGLRRMDDVLAAHRLAGGRPSTWWIADVENAPAGCVLVNDHTDSAEVVYLGVAPQYRRRGLARCMLERVARAAAARRLSALTLAVDAANTPARKAYASAGFTEIDRRIACFVTRKMLENAARKAGL